MNGVRARHMRPLAFPESACARSTTFEKLRQVKVKQAKAPVMRSSSTVHGAGLGCGFGDYRVVSGSLVAAACRPLSLRDEGPPGNWMSVRPERVMIRNGHAVAGGAKGPDRHGNQAGTCQSSTR